MLCQTDHGKSYITSGTDCNQLSGDLFLQLTERNVPGEIQLQLVIRKIPMTVQQVKFYFFFSDDHQIQMTSIISNSKGPESLVWDSTICNTRICYVRNIQEFIWHNCLTYVVFWVSRVSDYVGQLILNFQSMTPVSNIYAICSHLS